MNIIPAVEMDARMAKLRERALFDPALAPVLQKIGASSEMPTLDVQGRIRISDKLLQFANLTTTVAMLGSVRMIKLWYVRFSSGIPRPWRRRTRSIRLGSARRWRWRASNEGKREGCRSRSTYRSFCWRRWTLWP